MRGGMQGRSNVDAFRTRNTHMKKWIFPALALVVLGVIVAASLVGSRPAGRRSRRVAWNGARSGPL